MAWITPKTDWESSDYFNIEDYNRIAGNLEYIRAFRWKFVKILNYIKMGRKTTHYDYLMPDEVNNFQENLHFINDRSYQLDLGDDTTYVKDGNTPTYEQWNRLETFTENIHDMLVEDNPQLGRLQMKFGNLDSMKGIRV